MNEDAGYKYFALLFATGIYAINDIIENRWFASDPGAALGSLLRLEEQAEDVLSRLGAPAYDEAMALLPNLQDDSSEFLGRGPKYVALGFACGILALAHSRDTLDVRMGREILEGSTHNATVVMDYFGVTSIETCEALMIRLRTEASGFLRLESTAPNPKSSQQRKGKKWKTTTNGFVRAS